ncbi:MAG TPA: SBBP repeat-containing protein [Terriglobales bacterium]|nr:SBBP repeat-containing protein [Terriglobales bacterium]
MVNRSGAGPVLLRFRGLCLLMILLVGGAFLLKHDVATSHSSGSQSANSPQIRAVFARLPMSFEPNQGQTDASVKFLAHGNGYGFYLLSSEAVLTLPARTKSGLHQTGVEMRLEGANHNAELEGAEQLPGHSNYFIGNDPTRWRRNIPQFAKVRYKDVYPGIDLAFYGNQNRLEYDFEVSPGSDTRQIELNFKGANNVGIASNGDLVLDLSGRELRFQSPHIYQHSAKGEQVVAGAFVLHGNDSAGFEIGPYDHSRTLVIDPVLTFSSYLGGSGDEACSVIAGAAFVPNCPSIAIDSAGTIYVAGATTTPNTGTFSGGSPHLIGAMGTADVFVAHLAPSSSGGVTTATLQSVTYLGGTGTQYPAGVGVGSGFDMYVAGTTNAPDFPTTSSAFQTTPSSAGNHAFVSKIDPTGSVNLYTTYLSGNGIDVASNMALDTQGRVYVIGTTTSTNFPTSIGALQSTSNAANQFFFSKINPARNTAASLEYSTYIGGSTPSNGVVTGGAVAVDANFNVYLAGGTSFTDMGSPNPWIVNALQSTEQGGLDVWAAKLNAPANNTQQYTVAYGTYFGGSGDDVAYGVGTDNTNTYITGSTNSVITPPSTTLSYQACLDQAPSVILPCPAVTPVTEAFVAKLGIPAVTGTTQGAVPIDYFSYLGGSGLDAGLGIVSDSLGNARVAGVTSSANFPVSGALQGSFGGGASDAFFARLNTTGTSTSTNTSTASFLGGSGTDIGTSIALDSALNTYFAGETSSGNFPVANPLAGGGSLSGGSDAFVSIVGPNTAGLTMPQTTDINALPACRAANPTVSPSPAGVGSPVTFSYYIYNTGDPVSGVVFTDTLGIGSGSTSATTSQGTCGGATTTGPLICNLGTVNSSITTTTPTSCTGSTGTTNFATKVTVTVTAPVPTTPLQGPSSIGNSASLSFPGGTLAAISGAVPVNDFSVSAALASGGSSTLPSGGTYNYQVTVTPTGAGFSESVSLTCGSGLPAGATCTFTNNPIPNMSGGPQSRALAISTTARVTTTADLVRHRLIYALWLPIFGMGLLGAGTSRRRRMLLGIFIALLIGTAALQVGCGYSSSTRTTTGTPAGTYTVIVNATSGAAVRTTSVQFTVE